LFVFIILIFIIFISQNVYAADPTLDSISINPVKPSPLSKITLTADISGEGITAVVIHVKECSHAQGVCFSEQSQKMNDIETGEFQARLTLKEKNADYIQYYFDITVDGEEVRLLEDAWTIDLSVDSNNDSNNDSNGDSGTPGFELAIVFVAIIGLVVILRKRD